MNLKQLSILIVLVLVVGGVGRVLYKRNAETWQSSDRPPEQKLLGEFPVNDVAQVTIKKATNQVTLLKKDDTWKVQERFDYPANYTDLHEFLRKLWELKGVQKVSIGASQLSRLELLAPDKGTNGGTIVDLKDKTGKTMKSLLLGKKHLRQSGGGGPSPFGGEDPGWPDGRYVLLQDNSQEPNVWVVTEPFSNAEPKPEQWIGKDFVKVEKIKTVSVVSTNATNSWRVVRDKEGGDLKLADKKDGEELDSSKTWGIGNLFSSANIVDVLPPDTRPETCGLDKPITATVETFDNFTYNVQVGHGTNDENIPLRVTVVADIPKERVAGKDEKAEDKTKLDKEFKEKNEKLEEKLKQEKAFEKWTVLVSKYTVDSLLKGRGELLAAKKEEKKEEKKSENGDDALKEILPPIVPGVADLKLDAKPAATTVVPSAAIPAPSTNAVIPAVPSAPVPTNAVPATTNEVKTAK